MAKDATFDIVSEVDLQEVNNAINQTNKEITQRYDFKGSKSMLALEDKNLKMVTEDEMRMRSIIDILQSKFLRRGVAIENLIYGKVENTSGGMVKQVITIQQGIEGDVARKITKDIKETKLKVQTQFMEDKIRVSAKKIDDLQAVMAFLREKDYGIALQFNNFRS